MEQQIPTLHAVELRAIQRNDQRLESGMRVFRVLSWTGGLFGIAVFVFAFLSGTPITTGFILVVSFFAVYLALPFTLQLTKRLDLIVVIGLIWLVVCIGVAVWHYGGYAAAALPWLCAIPIFSHYYLRGTKLLLVLVAMTLCFVFVSAQQLAGHATSETMSTKAADMVYGASFALLLVFLSIASHMFRSAEHSAQEIINSALADAKRARQRAEEANAVKSRLLASMSHELRTPLNAIVGFSDFMRQKHLSAVTSAKIQEYAEDVYASAKYLVGIVDDILEYTEMGNKKTKVMLSNVDLRSVVKSALKMVVIHADANDRIIEQHFPDELPLLSADERLLNQIVINLLINAIKFTDKGGRISVSIGIDGAKKIKLSVSDTGIGIPADDLVRITQPFFKSAHSDRAKSKGLGLGLAITSELIDILGGTLTIESEVGVGTTVTCVFPTP